MKLLMVSIPASVLAVFLLSGCAQTQPSRFYVLTPEAEASNKQVGEVAQILGLRVVSIPEFIDRPHITQRLGENEIRISQFHRWAGSLDSNISQVLAANLEADLSGTRVLDFPWGRTQSPETAVNLDIHRFDGEAGGKVFLNASWTLAKIGGGDTQHTGQYSVLSGGEDYNALVAAMSDLLAELSADIATSLE